jgi:hypothetical protein
MYVLCRATRTNCELSSELLQLLLLQLLLLLLSCKMMQ